MILVTGATGALGRHVVQQLLGKVTARDVAVAARNPARAAFLADLGVDVREADYDSPKSYSKAMIGVDRVLLISSNEIGKREQHHKTVVDAATAAGVKQLAYTSILHADTTKLILAKDHLATERYIKASGLAYAFLRNGWYLENYTDNLGSALKHGVLAGAAGEGRIYAAARADYAAAAAAILTAPVSGHAVYELAGDTGFSLADLANTLSRAAGRTVTYRNMNQQAYQEILLGAGVPEALAHMLADSEACAAHGHLADSSGTLHRLVGRATTTLETAVRAGLERAAGGPA